MKRALVVRGGAIGDFILTLPVLRALECALGRGNVAVLANRNVASLWRESPFALDDSPVASLFARASVVPNNLAAWLAQFACAISYLHDPNQIFAAKLRACGIAVVVGGCHRPNESNHATEQLAMPLRDLGILIDDLIPRLAIEPAPNAETFVALHPGSGSKTKNWPIENWSALCKMLLEKSRVVVVGGEADRKQVATLRERFGDELRYAIDYPLRDLAALLCGNLFVGHDSGISHLAAAAGANCLVLFGLTNPEVWAPRGENVHVIRAPDGDLTKLDVTTVAQALMRIGIST